MKERVEIVTSPTSTIREALVEASRELTSAGLENSRREAAILVSHVLGLSGAQLHGESERQLSGNDLDQLAALVARRARNEPIAYLVGEKEFWSLTLQVNPSVLIPRPETECLVEACLERMPIERRLEVLEIGVGSGAIVAALATERPAYEFTATDVSADALATARLNLEALESIDRVRLVEGDLFTPVHGCTFDWIVSNPPYVSLVELPDLMAAVRDFEPEVALVAGDDGLDVIRRLAAESRAQLHGKGKLAIEHGATQQDEIAEMLQGFGFEVIVRGRDYAGLPRFVIAELG